MNHEPEEHIGIMKLYIHGYLYQTISHSQVKANAVLGRTGSSGLVAEKQKKYQVGP